MTCSKRASRWRSSQPGRDRQVRLRDAAVGGSQVDGFARIDLATETGRRVVATVAVEVALVDHAAALRTAKPCVVFAASQSLGVLAG